VDARRRRVEGFEGAAGALEEERPRPGRLRPLAHALEERHGEGLFELPNVQAYRRLAQVEDLGGPREALEPHDLVEGAEVDGIDGHHYQNFS
jgi:hypothetical protein